MRYVEDRAGYEAELFVDSPRIVRDVADEIYSDYSYRDLKRIKKDGKIFDVVRKYNSRLSPEDAEVAFTAALNWAAEDSFDTTRYPESKIEESSNYKFMIYQKIEELEEIIENFDVFDFETWVDENPHIYRTINKNLEELLSVFNSIRS